jgi:flavin reductase (DIM6/NTAB) family NADH-FMN oxidoreductase RutF
MTETHFYEPSRGHRLPHDPLKAIVAPRPIGWISSVNSDGAVNLAPYSFFNMICEHPPMLVFSSYGYKDTVRNIEATGEFVANLAGMAQAEAMNLTCAPVGPEVDEMAMAGLAAAPSQLVRPPRVAVAPAALECKLVRLERLCGLDGQAASNWMVIGQIVGVHIRPEYLANGSFNAWRHASGAVWLSRGLRRGGPVSGNATTQARRRHQHLADRCEHPLERLFTTFTL